MARIGRITTSAYPDTGAEPCHSLVIENGAVAAATWMIIQSWPNESGRRTVTFKRVA